MGKQEPNSLINPQLCKTLNPSKHKWDHPWIAEPKYDGLRCIIVETNGTIKAYSRNGKPLWNMDLILEELKTLPAHGFALDGEVYTQDWNLSMGIVKSSVTAHPDADKLRYHVWDCLNIKEMRAGKSDVSNEDRKLRLSFVDRCKYTHIVQGIIVHNDEELKVAYSKFLDEGYEGAIIKSPQGSYECGRRSPNWLKIKPWSDADLKVIGAYPGEGKHQGRVGGLELEGICEWNGRLHRIRTEVGSGFTDVEREDWQKLVDKGEHIGKIVEIKFQEITADGACRFPIYNRLRSDKE